MNLNKIDNLTLQGDSLTWTRKKTIKRLKQYFTINNYTNRAKTYFDTLLSDSEMCVLFFGVF